MHLLMECDSFNSDRIQIDISELFDNNNSSNAQNKYYKTFTINSLINIIDIIFNNKYCNTLALSQEQ